MMAKVVLVGDKNRLVLRRVLPAPGVVRPARRERVLVYVEGRAGPSLLTVYLRNNEVYADVGELFAV